MPKYSFDIHIKKDNREKVLKGVKKACEKTLNDIGDKVIEHIKERVPVDTGALRDSYMKDVDAQFNMLRVGSPLAYAPFQELGTGPNYDSPPDWVTNNAQRGHHTTDPWWYFDEDTGEWKQGWFVRSQPHLRPAFLKHVNEYMRIFKKNLKNG